MSEHLLKTEDEQSLQSSSDSGEHFRFWDFPLEMDVREEAPGSASREARDTFDRTVADGVVPSGSTEGRQMLVVIGLDFGTSSTKVIVRLPGEAGEPTIAIPAPEHCRSENHPYLWQTVLWVRGNGEFVCYPETGSTLLRGLKQSVMRQDLDVSVSQPARTEATVAYLSYVIRFVKGWLARNRSELFRERRVFWLINLGLPAANYDNRSLVRGYRKAAVAALELADSGMVVTADAARGCLQLERVDVAARLPEKAQAVGISIVPEVAAAATPFAMSTGSVPGLYLLVDVGAMTLDACMFRLVQNPGDNSKYPLLSAAVRPLGVEAFHWFTQQGRSEEDFRTQCRRCLYKVVWDTRLDRDPNDEVFRPGNKLPVFLTGGGSRNNLHRSLVEELSPWLIRFTQNEGIDSIDLPTPVPIEFPVPFDEPNRLAVAWGLSYPPEDIGEINPMSNIPNVARPAPFDLTDRYISKDQV